MKNIPLAALIGLFFTALYFLMAIFAPLIARDRMVGLVAIERGTMRPPPSFDRIHQLHRRMMADLHRALNPACSRVRP